MSKPFSQACENNKKPILKVLKSAFSSSQTILEVGSGTGQHAVYFAEKLPHLIWQTSDRIENHYGINTWIEEAGLDNVVKPIELDVNRGQWPESGFDGIFTANTLHIMSWQSVCNFFAGLPKVMAGEATLCIYGPFNYGGQFTSESNAQFDQWLKRQFPHQGIRDFEQICQLAKEINLELAEDNEMPANNRLLVFKSR